MQLNWNKKQNEQLWKVFFCVFFFLFPWSWGHGTILKQCPSFSELLLFLQFTNEFFNKKVSNSLADQKKYFKRKFQHRALVKTKIKLPQKIRFSLLLHFQSKSYKANTTAIISCTLIVVQLNVILFQKIRLHGIFFYIHRF